MREPLLSPARSRMHDAFLAPGEVVLYRIAATMIARQTGRGDAG